MATTFFVALTALSAIGKMNNANAQAKADIEQANQQEQVSMLNTEQKAGAAKASFLSSGLTMAGTPELAVKNIFTTGVTDVGRIGANANTAAKNAIAEGRSAAIGQIAGSAAMASAAGSMGSMFNPITENPSLGLGAYGGGYGMYGGQEIDWERNL